jgi:hypothetical protein
LGEEEQLPAFRHEGFCSPTNTLRGKNELEWLSSCGAAL